jgi:predicted transcriptional regulator
MSDHFQATFSAREANLPAAVRIDGIYYRVEPPGARSEESGALPPDLLAGLNLAKAHIHLASVLMGLLAEIAPAKRKTLCKERCCSPSGTLSERATYIANEILGQNGAEVIRALQDLPNRPGQFVRVGPVAEANYHRAAYAAALQIAEEARRGLPFTIAAEDFDQLLVAVEKEAWSAARNGGSADVAERPQPTLDNEDISILFVLAKETCRRLSQKRIARQSAPRVAERTIAERMPRLEAAGLVERPQGEKGGYTITQQGRLMLEKLEKT